MKTRLLRSWVRIKNSWNQNNKMYLFEREERRRRVKEISKELLEQPLSERLIMLKKINDIILIQSNKQRLEFEEMSEYWKQELNKFRL